MESDSVGNQAGDEQNLLITSTNRDRIGRNELPESNYSNLWQNLRNKLAFS